MCTINGKYKDSLFRKLFGDPANKKDLLALFNVLNKTNYDNEDDLEINTLEDVIYMGMKNDVSCILDGHMSLYEHQSTFNPNMPLRGLMYFGKLYDKYIKKQNLNIYSRTLLKIPTPKYFVLYNGNEKDLDSVQLRLSDAFIQPKQKGEYEWTATLLNINCGHNEGILDACSTLRDYSIFVERVKQNRRNGLTIEEAVRKAVDDCIHEGVLRDYFMAHKAEVIGMCITEYNEAETMQMFKEEGRAEGRAEGREEGRAEGRKEILLELESLGINLEELRARKKIK